MPATKTKRKTTTKPRTQTSSKRVLVKTPKPKAKPGPRANGKQPAKANKAAELPGDVETVMLPIAKLVPSKTNPRKHFDKADLAELRKSIEQHGVLQSLLVLPAAGGKHAIVCGERRYRAAKAAGVKHVPCMVRQLTESQIHEMHLVENLDRSDLNDVELAQAIGELLKLPGMTQQKAAERLGKSQPWIANQLRLLRLPADWQKMIINQQIPATHALELVAAVDLPAVLKDVKQRVKRFGVGSVTEFRRNVGFTMEDHSRPMERSKYGGGRLFDVKSDELDAKLDIRKVTLHGRTTNRAFNTELWDKLQKEAQAKQDARTTKGGAKTRELTAAEKREREKQQVEQFNKRLYRYKIGWFQDRIAWKLDDCPTALLLKLLAYFTTRGRADSRGKQFTKTLAFAGISVETRREGFYGLLPDLWPAFTAAGKKFEDVVRETLKVWVRSDFAANQPMIDARDVEALAAELGISLESDWQLCVQFLELLTKEQILELAAELNVPRAIAEELNGMKRDAMIQRFISGHGPKVKQPPKALVNAKGA